MANPETKYGRYRLLRKIGSGSMGDVLLARAEGPEGFARLCAIKRVGGAHAQDPTYVKMFIEEARLVAQLNHPGIIQIFELGREREGWFLAMEYVHGKSLRALQKALLKRELTVTPELAAYIATRILAALSYVHDSKRPDGSPLRLIHRDVKPENVLLSFHGDVKLADFGIARAAGAPGLTQTGAIRGTLPYVTPEQISSGAVTSLIDVWAVGVVLYELLAGERPFRGKGDFEMARSILRDTPMSLPARNPSVSPQLAAVVDRALQKDPAQRYQTAREMAAALEPLLIGANGRRVTDADVARALKETFPDEPDSPVTDRIGEPLVEGGSAEVVIVEPSSEVGTVSVATTRGERPLRGRRWAWALLATLAIAAGAASWLLRGGPPAPVLAGAPDAGTVAVTNPPLEPPQPEEPPLVVLTAPPPSVPVGTVDAGPEPALIGSKTGMVDVIVKPWAEVSFRGRKLGVTPLFSVPLPAGEQVLQLKNPELSIERRVKVRVDAAKTRRVTIDLEAGN